jgi:hypothetical protein
MPKTKLPAQCRPETELAGLRLNAPPEPEWNALRAGLLESIQSEDKRMGVLERMLAGRTWPVRLALGLAALAAVVALSLLLPFARGVDQAPKLQASSGGYVLVYDFGSQQPGADIHREGGAALEAWVKANDPSGSIEVALDQDVRDGQFRLTVSLIGATREQADSLAAALGTISGVPTPQVAEANWYQVDSVEAKKRGELFMYEFEHGFYFPRGTTGEQVEEALYDYVRERDGEVRYNIDVELEWTRAGPIVNIHITHK